MSVQILDPRDVGAPEEQSINPRVQALTGKVVGIRHKPRWTNFKVFGQEVEQILREQYGVRDVEWVEFDESHEHCLSKETMEDFTQRIDTAIVGLGA